MVLTITNNREITISYKQLQLILIILKYALLIYLQGIFMVCFKDVCKLEV